MVLVSLTLMVADSVGIPAGSPLRCNLITTGMQVLKLAAGEEVGATLAMTPVNAGADAVAKPLVRSILATLPADTAHVKLPIRLVMSVALWKAWATNCWVPFMEVQPATGSTVMEVTEGCTETWTGALLTPWALAVITAIPVIGLPEESAPLQTMKNESQTPPQTSPPGQNIATLVLDELKA